MENERYKHLQGDLYFDLKDKVIVKQMGNRFVFLRHDRRKDKKPVTGGKRTEDKFHYIPVMGDIYFDPQTRQLYKKTGANYVLYTKDRRRGASKVSLERRIKQL